MVHPLLSAPPADTGPRDAAPRPPADIADPARSGLDRAAFGSLLAQLAAGSGGRPDAGSPAPMAAKDGGERAGREAADAIVSLPPVLAFGSEGASASASSRSGLAGAEGDAAARPLIDPSLGRSSVHQGAFPTHSAPQGFAASGQDGGPAAPVPPSPAYRGGALTPSATGAAPALPGPAEAAEPSAPAGEPLLPTFPASGAPSASAAAVGGSAPTPSVPHGPAAVVHATAQVAQAMVARGPGETLEIRLDPPQLGRVQVAFEFSGDTPRAVVSAAQPETLDLLRRGAPILLQELAEAGLDGTQLEWSDAPLGGEAPEDRRLTLSLDATEPAQAEAPLPPAGRPLRHDGALDLTL